MLDQLSAAPGKPIPAACGDWAAAKAAYRFFDNPRVTEHSVLAGHFAANAARVATNEGPILILQDTTEFIYSRAQPGKIGFTKTINAARYKAGQLNVPRQALSPPAARSACRRRARRRCSCGHRPPSPVPCGNRRRSRQHS
ncbi:hypothetical protein NKJ23_33255 [Mesorhizobium sp. M0184]